MWFHRPTRANEGLPVDLCLHQFIGNPGLAVGDVFTRRGALVAAVAQYDDGGPAGGVAFTF